MSEIVEFRYQFRTDEEVKEINIQRSAEEEGLNCQQLCEAFVDLMESAGFSIDNVYAFFQ